jgi:hypothetical protein
MRDLTERERGILEQMLERLPHATNLLREQSRAAQVTTIDDDGSLSFSIAPTAPYAAMVVDRVPITAMFDDDDGIPVYLLLHILDGRLSELEIYKADGSKILSEPVPERLYF